MEVNFAVILHHSLFLSLSLSLSLSSQLARYCDQLLRKSSKGLGEQEVEEKLEKAVSVVLLIRGIFIV